MSVPWRTALVGVAIAAAACGGEPEAGPPPEVEAPRGVHGMAPPAWAGRPSVVMLDAVEPSGDVSDTLGGAEGGDPPTIDQLGLVFTPTTLIARVGERVVFTNSETITHNVHLWFTENDSTVFDAETDPGAQADFVFDRPGGYDVTCEHHPGMRAFIYITDSRWTALADNSGGFVVPDVPPGTYTLSVWSVNPDLRSERRIEVTGPSTEVDLTTP